MDADRKSTVSSFYQGRRPGDAQGGDMPRMSSSSRPLNAPRDDASSFYNPGERPSYDHLSNSRPSAGYNQGSYFNAGREEPVKGGRDEQDDEEAWDVYADFNNSGPKYSSNVPMGPTTSNG
jgi:hypothetical protein